VTPVNIFHLIKYASMQVIFQHSGVVFACILTDWGELWRKYLMCICMTHTHTKAMFLWQGGV